MGFNSLLGLQVFKSSSCTSQEASNYEAVSLWKHPQPFMEMLGF